MLYLSLFVLDSKCIIVLFVSKKNVIHIKACVQNKAQICASSACISGYVLSDKEQN